MLGTTSEQTTPVKSTKDLFQERENQAFSLNSFNRAIDIKKHAFDLSYNVAKKKGKLSIGYIETEKDLLVDKLRKIKREGKKDSETTSYTQKRFFKKAKTINKQAGTLKKSTFKKGVLKAHKDSCHHMGGLGFGKESIKQYHIKALNTFSESFQNTEKTMMYQDLDNNVFELKSSQETERNFRNDKHKSSAGTSSQDKNTDSLINANISKLELGGETIFKALRHGNTRGGENATKQLIENCIILQYGSAGIGNVIEKHTNPDNPLEITIFSMGLMAVAPELISSDKNLAIKQIAQLNKYNEKTIKLEINDKTFYAKPKIIAMNFGVNTQTLGSSNSFGGMLITKLKRKWKKELAGLNNDSLYTLIGFRIDKNTSESSPEIGGLVRDILKEGSPNAEEINILANSVRDYIIEYSKAQFSKGPDQKNAIKKVQSDAYGLQKSLILLCEKMGYAVAFNCASGKDRTGLMDAIVKEGAARLAIEKGKNKVRKAFSGETDKSRRNLNDAINASGSLEIGQSNTGVSGFKVDYKSQLKRIGGNVKLATAGGTTKLK